MLRRIIIFTTFQYDETGIKLIFRSPRDFNYEYHISKLKIICLKLLIPKLLSVSNLASVLLENQNIYT